MKKIKLSRGYEALVDDQDYEMLKKYKWSAEVNYSHVYASRKNTYGKKPTRVKMHRQIMEIVDRKELLVDHIDGNGLNNAKQNLRVTNYNGNNQNRKMRKDNTSGFKGVSFSKEKKKWRADISFCGKSKCIGYYSLIEDAAAAYDKAAVEIFGRFAKINEELE